MMQTHDPVNLDAFARLMARPDPADLPRRAHVHRYDGDPNRRLTRLLPIHMAWLQRRHLDVEVEEPIATARRRQERVHSRKKESMKRITIAAVALLSAASAACTQGVDAKEAQQIEQQYGVSGAYAGSVSTSDGSMKGTLVPITLANGGQAHLFIPQKQSNDPHAVYIRDEQGLHPVQLSDNTNREDLIRSPGIVETRPEPPHAHKRSWEQEALIIGGSAGAGTAIGAVAGGKKGAGMGAAAGGVGGLIFDLVTRNKE